MTCDVLVWLGALSQVSLHPPLCFEHVAAGVAESRFVVWPMGGGPVVLPHPFAAPRPHSAR